MPYGTVTYRAQGAGGVIPNKIFECSKCSRNFFRVDLIETIGFMLEIYIRSEEGVERLRSRRGVRWWLFLLFPAKISQNSLQKTSRLVAIHAFHSLEPRTSGT